MQPPKADAVNHPAHYTSHPSGVECIVITEHMNFNAGNAVKYLWRAGLKDAANSAKHIEDLEKAVWYAQREVNRMIRAASGITIDKLVMAKKILAANDPYFTTGIEVFKNSVPKLKGKLNKRPKRK